MFLEMQHSVTGSRWRTKADDELESHLDRFPVCFAIISFDLTIGGHGISRSEIIFQLPLYRAPFLLAIDFTKLDNFFVSIMLVTKIGYETLHLQNYVFLKFAERGTFNSERYHRSVLSVPLRVYSFCWGYYYFYLESLLLLFVRTLVHTKAFETSNWNLKR